MALIHDHLFYAIHSERFAKCMAGRQISEILLVSYLQENHKCS